METLEPEQVAGSRRPAGSDQEAVILKPEGSASIRPGPEFQTAQR